MSLTVGEHEIVAVSAPRDRPDWELDLSTMRSAADVETEMSAAVPAMDAKPAG